MKPDKLDLGTLNIPEDKKAKLKEVFPEVFSEDKIDLDKLKTTLGEEIDNSNEMFGLTWAGKGDCFKVIQEPSIATLKPCKEESVNWDTTENLFIEGDNLEVLKQLQKAYYGKVKMIYIDPPYNTGNEFIYPDNYQENLNTYLSYTGQVDEGGKKFSTNTETAGRFHSNWLNMMYPRLFLARNLLRNDGIIFISIDDHEYENLKKICNEIFGEENFVANFIWEKRTNRENRKTVSTRHDYVLCYVKEKKKDVRTLKQLPMNEKALANYKNPDNDPKGLWKSDPATAQAGHGTKNQFYELIAPIGKVHKLESGRCWLYTQPVMAKAIENNEIWFGKDGNGVPRVKTYLDAKERRLTPESIFFAKEVTTTEVAKNKLKYLFNGIAVFDTPKPVDLFNQLLLISTEKNDLCLDFFAGSCPLAHSVLEQNRTEGNNRKFIMVQLPEPTEENSEAHKAGYKTIADIGKERIRRVIKEIEEEEKTKTKEEKGKLQFEGDKTETKDLDLGFKVFKLDKSNFKIWDGSTETKPIEEQLRLGIDHIDPDSSDNDILYEILLKSGFQPTVSIQKLNLAGKTVYSIADGALLICLDKELTKEVLKAITEKQPARVVCLDMGFKGNDQLKTNAVQIMKSHQVEDFRTV